MAIIKANPNMIKFFFPLISLYKKIPHSDEITGGPELDIGKETA